MIKMSPKNLYLLSLLSTLFGIILLISNAKNLIALPGLLLISIFLIITPAIIIALSYDSNNFSRIQSLSLVILPLIFINYLFYIEMDLPVGFQDIHEHIMQYQQLFGEQGNILFSNAQSVSFNFVGLYVIFRFLLQVTNLDLITMALLIPPFFNLIIVLTVYTIVNKLHSHKVALIAVLFFGWENQIIIFGHEIRTQTIGTLLLFTLLSLFMIHQKSFIKNLPYTKTALIIVVFSIVTTSFISILYTSMILLMIMITANILPELFKWPKKSICITWSLIGLFLIFFLSYLFHISAGFENMISTLINLFNETIKTEGTISYSGPPIYGTFATNVNRMFWVIFLIFSGFYAIDIIKRKNLEGGVLFTGFGFLLVFWVFNFILKPLSPSRIYIVGFLIMAIVVSFGLFKMQNSQSYSRKWHTQFASRVFAYIIIALFVTSSVVQFPNYIIGETNPIRGEEPIDTIPYWDSDLPQYAVSSFLLSSAENQSIYLNILIENYYLRQVFITNNMKFYGRDSLVGTLIPANQINLVLLHDNFKGQVYTHRNLLPKSEVYNQFSQIYSNKDYIICKVI